MKDIHDLRRKGELDAERLKEKVREAIRKDIKKYIIDESIISEQGDKTVKIPLQGLKLPEFSFGENQGQGVGSGDGEVQEGEAVPQEGGEAGDGEGEQAGNERGEHGYEKEISIDDLVDIAFEELGLPYLQDRENARIASRRNVFCDIRKTGPYSRLDIKRTLKENMKRNAISGKAYIGDIIRDDLRFKTYEERMEKKNNAVIIAMMDVSGSMTDHKKYLVRMTLWWIKKYLERLYDGLEFVFIIHDIEAQVVDEESFFHTSTGGGTHISSAFEIALEVIDRDFPPNQFNIYPFYFSDGDNWSEDNEKAVTLAKELIQRANMVYYGEVAASVYANFYKVLTEGVDDDDHLLAVKIKDEKEVAGAIARFLSAGRNRMAA